MIDSELPRAYAHPANSSCSSSSSEEKSSSTSSAHSEQYESSSSSTSTTYSSSASSKKAAKKRYRRRRDSTSSSRSRSRSERAQRKNYGYTSKYKRIVNKSSSRYHETNSRSTHDVWERGDTKYNRTSGPERFTSTRNMTRRNTRRTFDCECGEKFGSQKALVHHTLQNHDADIPCFACDQTLPSLSRLMEHFQNVHQDSLVICVYCKSVFGNVNGMSDDQWKRWKTHMYGELVYAKLAEMQD